MTILLICTHILAFYAGLLAMSWLVQRKLERRGTHGCKN